MLMCSTLLIFGQCQKINFTKSRLSHLQLAMCKQAKASYSKFLMRNLNAFLFFILSCVTLKHLHGHQTHLKERSHSQFFQLFLELRKRFLKKNETKLV